MKVSEITGRAVNLDQEDNEERDSYVSRFLAAMRDDDLTESQKAALVYPIHLEIRERHDLYMAVFTAIGAWSARWIREYVREAESPGHIDRMFRLKRQMRELEE